MAMIFKAIVDTAVPAIFRINICLGSDTLWRIAEFDSKDLVPLSIILPKPDQIMIPIIIFNGMNLEVFVDNISNRNRKVMVSANGSKIPHSHPKMLF